MRNLSLLVLYILLTSFTQKTESPHGKDFRISCSVCHSSNSWKLDKKVYSFNHNATRFALTGQHTTVNCRLCHESLVFNEAKRECNECHNDIHQATTGKDCGRCHTPASWLVSNINEIHQSSRFPLLGAHRTADCSDCHKSENLARFDVPGVNCIDCHRKDYLATTNPNHVQSGMSEDCSLCHLFNGTQWSDGAFNHDFFPLSQGHGSLHCKQCHTTGSYTDASPECYSCHKQDFLSTTSPNHSSSGFTTVCTTCHTLAPGWKPAAFDHSSFPLTLGHSTPSCADCHKNGNYSNISSDCYSCHQADFTSSTDPNHVSGGFPTVCLTCHTTNPGWKPTTFNHNSFPLTLGHSAPACQDCHKNGNYTNLSSDCYSCHAADYTTSTDPNHTAAGFPTVCLNCHSTNPGWKPTTFSHGSFPLTLGHSSVSCAQCHTGGNYTTTSAACYSCHAADYNSATNPNHASAGFPHECQTCHTTNPGWQPASYDHSAFPLTLGHSGVACTTCHTGGNYTSLSTDCYSCHSADYNGTTNPNHRTLSFSTSCATCHTTNPGWQPASYTQHDTQFFPIYSGRHRGVWDACSDCHTNPSNYTAFNCINCHSNAHQGQGYTNSQCYNCHPRGNAD